MIIYILLESSVVVMINLIEVRTLFSSHCRHCKEIGSLGTGSIAEIDSTQYTQLLNSYIGLIVFSIVRQCVAFPGTVASARLILVSTLAYSTRQISPSTINIQIQLCLASPKNSFSFLGFPYINCPVHFLV